MQFCQGHIRLQSDKPDAEPALHEQLITGVVLTCACTNRQSETTVYMGNQTTLHSNPNKLVHKLQALLQY